MSRHALLGCSGLCPEKFFKMVQFGAFWSVFLIITTYSFEQMLTENANFRKTTLIIAFFLSIQYGIKILFREDFEEIKKIATF